MTTKQFLATAGVAGALGITAIMGTSENPVSVDLVGKEIVSLRKPNMIVMQGRHPRKQSAIITAEPKFAYDENGRLNPIDLSIHEVDESVKNDPKRTHDTYVDAGNYQATWFDSKPHDYTFYCRYHYAKFTARFDTKDVSFETKPRSNGMKQNIYLGKGAAPVLSWLVKTDANTVLFEDGGLWFYGAGNSFLFRTRKFTVFDAQMATIPYTPSYDGNILIISLNIPANAVYPIEIDPSITVDDSDALTGALTTGGSASYASAHDTTDAIGLDAANIRIGQYYGSLGNYRVLLRFDTSGLPNSAQIDSAKVKLVVTDVSWAAQAFYMMLCAADDTLSSSHFEKTMFNTFEGWVSGANGYVVTLLSDSLLTSDYSGTDTLTFVMESAGLGEISKTTTSQFYLLDNRDIARNDPGTTNETVFFEDDSPYIEVYYTLPKSYQIGPWDTPWR